MKTWKKVSLIFAACLILMVAFTIFILPGIVKERAIREVESATGRKLSIGRIAINPFTWTAEVDKVRLSEKGKDATFVSFSSARVSVSPSSIFRFAPVASEFRIVSPYVHLERTAPNAFNFSDLLQRKQAGKAGETGKKQPGKGARFALNNIIITNGSIDFHDKAVSGEKFHTVRRIDLSLPFVGNMPYMASRYVTPSLKAVVNGAPFRVDGKLKVYPELAEASIDMNLKELSLPYYQAYVPVTLPVSADRGMLTTALNIRYQVAAKTRPELILSGSAGLADIFLRDRTGSPVFGLKRGEARIRQARLLGQEFNLASITTEGMEPYLSRDRRGTWNHQRIAGAKSSPPSERKIMVSVDTIRMRDGLLHFADRLPKREFETDLRDINIDLDGFTTAPGKKAIYAFSAGSGRGEKLAAKGEFSLNPLFAASSVDLNSLVLESYYPYLDVFLRNPVKGRLDLKTELSFSSGNGLRAVKTDAQLRQISASFGKNEGIRLTSVALKGGDLRLAEKTLTVDAVAVNNGDLRFSRNDKGAFSFEDLFRAGTAPKHTGSVAVKGKGTAHGKPFRYLIKKISGDRVNVTFADGMKEDRPVFRMRGIRVGVSGFSGPTRLSPFSFSAGYGKSATMKGNGSFRGDPLLLAGNFTVRRLPIVDFEPYLPENVMVTLADGTVDTRINLRLEKKNNNLTGKFRGELGVRSFYSLDGEGNDLLKWENLQIDRISGGIGPFSLYIDDIALDNFYSRVVVDKDGTLNLQQLVEDEEDEKPERKTPAVTGKDEKPKQSTAVAAAAPQADAAPAAPPASGRGAVRIDSITMQGGILAFTDLHLKDEYSSTFYNLGGRISGLSSEENRFADVDLRGNLQNLSPLSITGKINPLREDLFVDLKVSFKDIDISPFTPYSGTYLGYTVEKGKLFLDLKYRIERKKLNSENRIFIDQFTFGGKVESDKATNLPVRLAVALLKDRKGEIHLDLPVTGQTDDPQFSVWRVVLKILKNLLAKAATSPFALLSSMIGGDEDFSSVTFPFGSAEITPAEREKLLKLATALKDRPGVKTEITGYVAKEQDAEGYRNELLRKKMKTERFLDLTRAKKNQPGDSPDTMTIGADEYSKYLKAVYKKEKFPKPRTIIGTVKDIPDGEKKKLILAHTVVTDESLRALARERASAVANFLVKEGKLDSARLFQKSGDIFKPPAKEGGQASRVEFGATAE